MATIYLDLETIPVADPAIIAEIEAGVKAPGNLKKAETIEAWERDEKPAAVLEAVRKTGLDGTYGRICCIGFAVDDEPVECSFGNEEDVLRNFFRWLESAARISDYTDRQSAIFIGHNVLSFDLRFLWQRCVVNGIRPPAIIPFNAKPWDGKVFDTMMAWNPERDKKISLDKLCIALCVPTSKGDIDGSKVAEYWQAGRHQEVAEYCMADVEATRQCHKRMLFA